MADANFKAVLEGLLREEHSLERTLLVAELIQGDADKFAVAWEIFCTADPPLPQRMAWVMQHVTDQHPALAARWATSIAARLPYFDHPAELRAATRMLANVTIPREAVPDLVTFLFPVLENPVIPVAIRVHAMQILYNISEMEPGLKHELALVIEMQAQFGSSGFLSRARKLLAKLRRQIQN